MCVNEQVCPCCQMLALRHIASVNTHAHDATWTCWCRDAAYVCGNACQYYQGTSLGHGLHVNMHAHTYHLGTVLGQGTYMNR